jgi:peptidoglycan/xylan/chitin deacetylase (PgdA/CDA1 family)
MILYQLNKDFSDLFIFYSVLLKRLMKISFRITVIVFLLNSLLLKAQTIGQATVKTWANDSKSAFSFSFDDSFQSQYDYARPVLDKYGLKATFYLIAGSIVDQGQAQIWRYGNWQEFKEMAQEGHEMGAHTMTHPDLTKLPVGDINTPNTIDYELYQSKSLIQQKIGQPVITLAYPYTSYNSTVINEAAKYFEASRAGNDTYNSANITGNGWQKLNALEEDFNLPRSSFSDDIDELNNVKSYIQNIIANDKWGILFGHEVLPYSQIPTASQDTADYWYPMAAEWLDSLCNYMKTQVNNQNVWVSTVANVTRYMKERENFASTIIAASSSRIELNVTDNLNDSIFNYPLTVDIQVPSNWKSVVISQGSNQTTQSTFTSGTSTLVRTDVIPDGGSLILTNSANLYTISGKVTYPNTSSSPIKDVAIALKDSNNAIETTITDSSGNYSFTNLTPGNYTITASKTGGWGGANAADALLDAKYYTNSITFDQYQIAAGDVDNNGIINSTDALLILKRYTGLILSFSIPDWIFNPSSSMISITNQDVVKNIIGITAGNVSKSYIPQ